MKHWNLRDFAGDESGNTMIEYAVVLSLTSMLIFGSITTFGVSLDGVFGLAQPALAAENGSGPGNGNGNSPNPGNGGGNTSGSGPGTGNGGSNNGGGGGAGNGGGGAGNGGGRGG